MASLRRNGDRRVTRCFLRGIYSQLDQVSSNQLTRILDTCYIIPRGVKPVQLTHLTKPGKVTVPHPRRDLPVRTVKSILKQG